MNQVGKMSATSLKCAGAVASVKLKKISSLDHFKYSYPQNPYQSCECFMHINLCTLILYTLLLIIIGSIINENCAGILGTFK